MPLSRSANACDRPQRRSDARMRPGAARRASRDAADRRGASTAILSPLRRARWLRRVDWRGTGAGWQGSGMGDPETRVTLMNAMTVKTTTVRSTAAVADARDTARALLEDLRQPTIAPGSRGHRGPDRVRGRHQRPAPRRGHLHTGADGPPGHHRGGRPRPRLACATHAHP